MENDVNKDLNQIGKLFAALAVVKFLKGAVVDLPQEVAEHLPEAMVAIGKALRATPKVWTADGTKDDHLKSIELLGKELGFTQGEEGDDVKHTDGAQSEVSV